MKKQIRQPTQAIAQQPSKPIEVVGTYTEWGLIRTHEGDYWRLPLHPEQLAALGLEPGERVVIRIVRGE